MTPLHYYFIGQFDSDAKLLTLLNAGANPNIKSTDGVTPLMIACDAGDVEGIKLLLSSGGADPGIQDENGKRAIDYLDESEASRQVRSLLR